MSPKWAKKAHFGDIFYNVLNKRKSSYLMVGTLHFTISWRMGHFNESHQKLVFDVYQYSQKSICQIFMLQSITILDWQRNIWVIIAKHPSCTMILFFLHSCDDCSAASQVTSSLTRIRIAIMSKDKISDI